MATFAVQAMREHPSGFELLLSRKDRFSSGLIRGGQCSHVHDFDWYIYIHAAAIYVAAALMRGASVSQVNFTDVNAASALVRFLLVLCRLCIYPQIRRY